MMVCRSGAAFAAGLLACLLGSTDAVAGGLQVEPVRLTLTSARPITVFTVRNMGEQPVVLQVQAVAWAQRGDEELYTPTRELLATPPIFTLAPGTAQTLRVGLRRAPDTGRELAYRLYLHEISGPAQEQGLRVLLKLGVPVFVPPEGAAPRLHWRAERRPEGLRLSLANTGNAHVQIADLTLFAADDTAPLFSRTVAAYVLPGQSRRWDFAVRDPPSAGARLRVLARTSGGEADAGVVLE